MTAPQSEHQHQLVDADARYPAMSGNRIVMAAPIRCISCNSDQDALIGDMREHGHTVNVEDGKVVADVVLP